MRTNRKKPGPGVQRRFCHCPRGLVLLWASAYHCSMETKREQVFPALAAHRSPWRALNAAHALGSGPARASQNLWGVPDAHSVSSTDGSPSLDCGKALFPSLKVREGWKSGTESALPARASGVLQVTLQKGLPPGCYQAHLCSPRARLQANRAQEHKPGSGLCCPPAGPPDAWSSLLHLGSQGPQTRSWPLGWLSSKPVPLFHLGP